MAFDANHSIPPGANIKVIGIGGGGSNAVNTMIRSGLEGVDFMTVNTDIQALRFALPQKKIQIGKELTKGLGAGADPDVGRDAALEDRHELQEMLAGADMVFITAGMGGGTGTGGASVVAQIAREQGALTVAVVTKPFNFEGKRRRRHAEMGIERLRESVDTLITIPNQRLLNIATPDLSMIDAFRMADEVLLNAVKGISDIINIPGTVNVDFADVKTVMSSMGMALMGIGRASGENRAVEAAKKAISSPLLEDVNIEGATGILINITAGSSVSLMEVNEACSIVQDAAHEDANIIFGAVIDDSVGDEMRVTVIATGFPAEYEDSMPVMPEPQVRKTNYQTSSPSQNRPHLGSSLSSSNSFSATSFAERQRMSMPKEKPAEPKKAGASAFDGWQKRAAPIPVKAPIVAPPEITPPAKPVMPEPIANLETESSSVAEDLTRLTMYGSEPKLSHESEKIPEDLPLLGMDEQDSSDFGREEYSMEAEEPMVMDTQPRSSFRAMSEPLATTPSAAKINEMPIASPLSAFDDSDSDFDLGEKSPASIAAPAPLDSLFGSDETLSDLNQDDFDQKIDAALELAEKLRLVEEGEDELDVPAFLRDGGKDLSLD